MLAGIREKPMVRTPVRAYDSAPISPSNLQRAVNEHMLSVASLVMTQEMVLRHGHQGGSS